MNDEEKVALRTRNVKEWIEAERRDHPEKTWLESAMDVTDRFEREFAEYVNDLDIPLEHKVRILDFQLDAAVLMLQVMKHSIIEQVEHAE